jgi:hypothetical protein
MTLGKCAHTLSQHKGACSSRSQHVSLGKRVWRASLGTEGSPLEQTMNTAGPAQGTLYRPVERWRPSPRGHVLRAYFTLGILFVLNGMFWVSLIYFLFV